jgi:hypothetical protein
MARVGAWGAGSVDFRTSWRPSQLSPGSKVTVLPFQLNGIYYYSSCSRRINNLQMHHQLVSLLLISLAPSFCEKACTMDCDAFGDDEVVYQGLSGNFKLAPPRCNGLC